MRFAGIAKRLDEEPKTVTPERAPPPDIVVKGKGLKAKADEHLTIPYVGYA
jgi:hypothetical protein